MGCMFIVRKLTLSDLVRQHPSPLIINFEQVMKFFLVGNIYFTFFLPVVNCTFLRRILKNIFKGNIAVQT